MVQKKCNWHEGCDQVAKTRVVRATTYNDKDGNWSIDLQNYCEKHQISLIETYDRCEQCGDASIITTKKSFISKFGAPIASPHGVRGGHRIIVKCNNCKKELDR